MVEGSGTTTTTKKKAWDLSDSQVAARTQYRDAIISMKEDYITFKKQADGKNGVKLDSLANPGAYVTKADFIKYHAKGAAAADAAKAYDTLAGEDGILKATELSRLFYGWTAENTPQKAKETTQAKVSAKAKAWNDKYATKDGKLAKWAAPTPTLDAKGGLKLETPLEEFKRLKVAKNEGKLKDEALFDDGSGKIDTAKQKAFYAAVKNEETHEKHDGWAAGIWDCVKIWGKDVFNADWGETETESLKGRYATINEHFGKDWQAQTKALAFEEDETKRVKDAEQYTKRVDDYTTNVENGETGVKVTAALGGAVVAAVAAPVIVAAAGGATVTAVGGSATTAVIATETAIDVAAYTTVHVSDDLSADREVDVADVATNAALSALIPVGRFGIKNLWQVSKGWGVGGYITRATLGTLGVSALGLIGYGLFGIKKEEPAVELKSEPEQLPTPKDTIPATAQSDTLFNFAAQQDSLPNYVSALDIQQRERTERSQIEQQNLTKAQRDSIDRRDFFKSN